MATYLTAWLIGSVPDLNLDVTIGASAQNVSGDRYLYHPTASLSLLGGMVAAMTAAGVVGAAAVLTRDRKVKLSASGTFSVQWTNVELRRLLGFTGNLSAAASYTAPLVSPLLWSPAKPLTSTLSPLGCLGNTRPLVYATFDPSSGIPHAVAHGSRTDQQWNVSHVATDRMQTASELGGEWVRFFAEVPAKLYRWYLYEEAEEDPGSAVASTLGTGLGPYVYTPSGRAPSWDFRRSAGFQLLDRRNDLSIAARVVPEYT